MVDRAVRYSQILDSKILITTSATVVGTGAVGRQIALMLGAMGIGALDLVDHDKVGTENLGSQGWAPADVGKPKVFVLADTIRQMNPTCEVRPYYGRLVEENITALLGPTSTSSTLTFCGADSMICRAQMWEWFMKNPVGLFVDTRMGAMFGLVLSCWDEKTGTEYKETLFPEEEAVQTPCTSRTTIFCGVALAAMAVATAAHYLRGAKDSMFPRVSLSLCDMTMSPSR